MNNEQSDWTHVTTSYTQGGRERLAASNSKSLRSATSKRGARAQLGPNGLPHGRRGRRMGRSS
eukprot:4044193-Pyramimonas_sp.AAC.1